MHRLVCIIVVLVTATIAVAEPPATIEIVLDASATMNRPGVGGSPIHTSLRESMAAVVAETSSLRSVPRVGLRLAGGGPRTAGLESCSATGLVLPAAEPDLEPWIHALDAVEPWGLRPLIGSVIAALDDVEPLSQKRRIVIVVSGDDQCEREPRQVAAALAAQDRPTELRMVGLGLDQKVVDRFGSVPFRNATTAEELLAALRWAVLDIEDGLRPTGALLVRLTNDEIDPLVARVDLNDLATGSSHTKIVSGEARFELPVGRYRLAVSPEVGGRHEFRDLLILPEIETGIELDLRPQQVTAIDVGTDSVIAGAQTRIHVAGFVPERARMLFVDANGLAVSRPADPFENDGWTASPPLAGPLDLLLVGPVSGGVRRVLTSRPIIAVTSTPGLTAPEEVSVDEDFTVGWSGSQNHGDFVGLVPKGGAPIDVLACVATGTIPQAQLTAPSAEADLDLIYVTGATLAVVSRHPLKVTAPEAMVTAPARIAAGERIEITWSGPEKDEDFLSLAYAGSPDDTYVEWVRVEDGSPAVFRTPESPGSYEVRYVDGQTGEARARASVELVAVPIELITPETVTTGMRFEVLWTGPASHGDFLAISKPGNPPHRYSDWAPTNVGSPLTLAAPNKPGTYEIRYVAKTGQEILARSVIEIQP